MHCHHAWDKQLFSKFMKVMKLTSLSSFKQIWQLTALRSSGGRSGIRACFSIKVVCGIHPKFKVFFVVFSAFVLLLFSTPSIPVVPLLLVSSTRQILLCLGIKTNNILQLYISMFYFHTTFLFPSS